jgi:hypothetical protein
MGNLFSESLQRSKNINEKGGEKGCKLRSVLAAKDLPGNRQGQRAMVPCKSGQRGGKARTSSVGLEVPGQKQYVEMLMSGASRLVNVNEVKPSYEVPVRGTLRFDWREKEGGREEEKGRKSFIPVEMARGPLLLAAGWLPIGSRQPSERAAG